MVTVFERADRIGGLLMYGIPNMKLDKSIVHRRVDLLAQEGVRFLTNTEVGVNYPATKLFQEFDAVVLCIGRDQTARPSHRRPSAEGRPFRNGVPERKHQEPARRSQKR